MSAVVKQERKDAMLWFRTPPRVYYGWGTVRQALSDLKQANLRKCFLLTDRTVKSMGLTHLVVDALKEFGIQFDEFAEVLSNPSNIVVKEAVNRMRHFEPDHIIALGGGSVMDVAKVVRVIYDPKNPHTDLTDLYSYTYRSLLTDRKDNQHVAKLPACDTHIKSLVCIPTTSGTGSEMTPIAWVMDEENANQKKAIVSWSMTPDIVVTDGFFVKDLPKELAAATGFDCFSKAIESMVSTLSNDYTQGFSLQASRLVNLHLENSVHTKNYNDRSAMHNAASIAGMAVANAFVGVAHALAFALQATSRTLGRPMNLGIALSLVIEGAVKFNAVVDEPKDRYGLMAEHMGLLVGGESADEKVEKLLTRIREIRKAVGMPNSIKEAGLQEGSFVQQLDAMAKCAKETVGATCTNPREVSLDDLKDMLRKAYTQ